MMGEFERMLEFLDSAWYLRSEIVPCLIGTPGIGKTSAVEKHAKTHGSGRVVCIIASRCTPSETVGMTMPNDSKRSMEIYNSAQLSSLKDGDILFLDELLEADQIVLSTMLTLIESRRLADGTPLPDIQIVAATNGTISPQQLKLSIRQRFLFMNFDWSYVDIKNYIKQRTGIEVSSDVIHQVETEGNDYNVLTPRSLVKMYLWMDSVPADETQDLASVINKIWRSQLGSYIMEDRKRRDKKINNPEYKIKQEVKRMLSVDDLPNDFESFTLDRLIEFLTSLPNWDEVSEELANIQLDGVKLTNPEDDPIEF